MAASSSSSRRRSSADRPVAAAPAAPHAKGAGGTAALAENLLHDRMRLGIVSALAGVGSATFVELKGLLDASDGNLSVHARKLEDAGYVTCTKTFADRRPRSVYRLTPLGRRALQRYLDHMEALIETTRRNLGR